MQSKNELDKLLLKYKPISQSSAKQAIALAQPSTKKKKLKKFHSDNRCHAPVTTLRERGKRNF